LKQEPSILLIQRLKNHTDFLMQAISASLEKLVHFEQHPWQTNRNGSEASISEESSRRAEKAEHWTPGLIAPRKKSGRQSCSGALPRKNGAFEVETKRGLTTDGRIRATKKTRARDRSTGRWQKITHEKISWCGNPCSGVRTNRDTLGEKSGTSLAGGQLGRETNN
jgi:hypothetical protein